MTKFRDVPERISKRRTRLPVHSHVLAGKLDIGDAVVVKVQRGAELQYISFEID